MPTTPSAFLDLPVPPAVSVWLGAPGREAAYTHEADRVHYAASTMKLPLLVAAYRLHERGDLDLDAEVPVHNDHRSAYDGSPFVAGPGRTTRTTRPGLGSARRPACATWPGTRS